MDKNEKRQKIEWTVKDFLRGGDREVTLRFDPNDVITLWCHCEYDSALCAKEGNRVMLLRKVEVKNKDGSWSLYPSVTWLDGVENEEQLMTRAIIKKTGEKGATIMGSTDGVLDGELMVGAKAAGIYTESIDG